MTSNELRAKFLTFFKSHDHEVVPSSSLIPDDPSVLLTTAGMQQFKLYYTGERDPMRDIHPGLGSALRSKNAASVQKSFRTSDIEEVGDESHLTFFEMLGNFSFGGYFKEKAIGWAWEFMTETLRVSPDRMRVSIFQGDHEVPKDEESYRIWKSIGISDEKFIFGNRTDNFWGPTGNAGPCGPTSEIYVDGIEVWNLVFNEFYSDTEKKLTPLPLKGVDTGMGLERLSLIMQYPKHPERTIFETDLFRPLMAEIPITDIRVRRIIADHMRASVFLIADGVQPSNLEKGYVLRRLLRRAASFAWIFKLPPSWYERILQAVVKMYGNDYSELHKIEEIRMTIANENEKFEKTLKKGLKEFFQKYQELEWQEIKPGEAVPLHERKVISGEDAFYFHQTYGLTIDIIRDLASRGLHKVTVDEEGFEREFQKHKEISRQGQEKKFGGHGLVGYGGEISAEIPEEDRARMTRLHTATHLLHQALRDVLGDSVKQIGSDINSERTRFDFSYPSKVSPEDLQRIEEIVNEKIKQDLLVTKERMPYEEAIKSGALAFFKEKYPETVSVYSIGQNSSASSEPPFSRELCGGPHVVKTREIGQFRIIKEEAVGAGVRRIRAVVEP